MSMSVRKSFFRLEISLISELIHCFVLFYYILQFKKIIARHAIGHALMHFRSQDLLKVLCNFIWKSINMEEM